MKRLFFGLTAILSIGLFGCGSTPSGDKGPQPAEIDDGKVKYLKFSDHCWASGASRDISGEVNIMSMYQGVPVTQVHDFFGCNKITSVNIPDTVTTIESNAFQCCSSLAGIRFGIGVKDIGHYAFSQTGFAEITIPDTVTYMGMDVFSSCESLKSIHISKNVETLSDVLNGASAVVELTVPYIGGSKTSDPFLAKMFGYSYDWQNASAPKSLKKITVLESCQTIGENACKGCASLTTIELPSTITSLGKKCFYDCTGLSEIKFAGTKSDWQSITLGEEWNTNILATTVVCSDGTVTF